MLLRNIPNELTIPEALLFSSKLHSQLEFRLFNFYSSCCVKNFNLVLIETVFFFNSQLSLKF